MSGDVQPRKRKDKKRKKDETIEQLPTQIQPPPTPVLNEETIHIHKEEGTGGGICAKIVFFILFTALAVCIGLIITEHRGLTDLETSDSESRFSQIFDGWVDNRPSHEEEHSYLSEDHEEDQNEHEIEEHEDDDDDEEEEEEEENVSNADSEHQDGDHEIGESEEEIENEEEDDNADDSTFKDDDNELSEEQEISEEKDIEEEDEDENDEIEEDEDDEVDAADDNSQQQNADEDDENEDEDEYEVKSANEDDVDNSNENKIRKVSTEDEADELTPSQEEDQEQDDESSQRPENELDDEDKENEEKLVDEEDNVEETNNEGNSRMAVKIGVGLALLVVAHIVLVRKWKSANPNPSSEEINQPSVDLSRRNTIVVPPLLQDVEIVLEENVNEEYSEDNNETESDDDKVPLKAAKQRYQELRTTYSRRLTPDNDVEKVIVQKYKHEEYDDEEEDENDEGEEEDEDVEDDDDEGEEGEEDEDEDDEQEDEGSENEDYEPEEDDEELLKRLEAKYGKLDTAKNKEKQKDFDEQFSLWKRNTGGPENVEESHSEENSDDIDYEYENMTNKDDWAIRDQINEAQKTIKDNAAYAIKLFDVLLKNYPSSPRSLYGKAQALDLLADQKRSNDILLQAINAYLHLLKIKNIPDSLFKLAAERCINRMRFIGHHNRAIDVHDLLIKHFPYEPSYRNQLAVTYLTINKVKHAKAILEETLKSYPNDGFALVHYGFVLKTSDNNLIDSVEYLKKGISTRAPGVIDGRFYFHLGDALTRLKRMEEAAKIHEEGVKYKLFLSKHQRSLYNVNRLKAQPWWRKEDTPYQNLYILLEKNWKKIRDEGLSVLNQAGYFLNELENLKDTGDWKQFELFARGRKNHKNCQKCPFTCNLIDSVPYAGECKRGQTKFSVMHPGTHVWPHCGPTNCRLRVHLGLKVPTNTFLRVANEIRSWENGQVLIFDDSFEHEVWHNGTNVRLVLIVDVWHPELTLNEKKNLSPI